MQPDALSSIKDEACGENWQLYLGDSCEVLKTLPDRSVHFSVYSPPFSSLYTYTPSERDLGNVHSPEQFFEHHAFIARELLRVLLPGRVLVAHTQELQLYETRDGKRAKYDFPSDYRAHMESVGFLYQGRITINKNPQTAAIRNHPVELLFATLKRDASKLVVAPADYLLIFRAPGENQIPITYPVSEDTWIKWAHPVWTEENGTGVYETAILPDAGSKDNDDERHLCPLQLPVIDRCIRLWTNPGENVLSPFAGIGSEVYQAVKCGRRGIGVELKPSYFKRAVAFCTEAEQEVNRPDLFAHAGLEVAGVA
jgi:DNA modification methylase